MKIPGVPSASCRYKEQCAFPWLLHCGMPQVSYLIEVQSWHICLSFTVPGPAATPLTQKHEGVPPVLGSAGTRRHDIVDGQWCGMRKCADAHVTHGPTHHLIICIPSTHWSGKTVARGLLEDVVTTGSTSPAEAVTSDAGASPAAAATTESEPTGGSPSSPVAAVDLTTSPLAGPRCT